MSGRAGTVRIVGRAEGDVPLAPHECVVEVRQADGSWAPLRGVCSVEVHARPDELVTAHLVIEPTEVELVDMMVGRMQVASYASWWRRLVYKLRFGI